MQLTANVNQASQSSELVIFRPFNETEDPKNGVINQRIPVEVLLQILAYLSPSNLANARQVCRYWEYLINDFAAQKTLKRLAEFPLYRTIQEFDADAMQVDEPGQALTNREIAEQKIIFVWERFRDACKEVRLRPPKESPLFLSPVKIAAVQQSLEKRQADVGLIEFCYSLPDYLQEELPSLSIEGLTISRRATLLRMEMLLSASIPQVKGLHLEHSDLARIPKEIRLFTTLEVLNLSDNKITHVPKEIGLLVHLRELSFHGNQIESLPEELANLTQLTLLMLDYNKLRAIPDIFGGMTVLVDLYLGGNEDLVELPPSLGSLTSLTKLSLYNTKVTALPNTIVNLTSLVEFIVEGNLLETLPEGFGRNQQDLETFCVNNNRLTSLPESLRHARKMTTFIVRDNLLTALPDMFSDLPDLYEIDIKNNQLTTLPHSFRLLGNFSDDAMQEHDLYISLDLSHNRFTVFPRELFGIRTLTKLDLDENQITEVPGDLSRMKHLFDLSMRSNALTTLPSTLPSQLRYHFEGNPIDVTTLDPKVKADLDMLMLFGTGGY